LRARKRNPAIAGRTIELNESVLTRYLAPFFGELLPSEITKSKVKEYRERVHLENEQIRTAVEAGHPLRDARTGQRLRTLSNESINKTLLTLAQTSTKPKMLAGSSATSPAADVAESRSSVVAIAGHSTSMNSSRCWRLRGSSTGTTNHRHSSAPRSSAKCATAPA
jgi:hypothetical protein